MTDITQSLRVLAQHAPVGAVAASIDEMEAHNESVRRDWAKRWIAQQVAAIGIPERCADLSPSSFPFTDPDFQSQKNVMDRIAAWGENLSAIFERGIHCTLKGGVGTGKSSVAGWMGRQVVASGRSAKMIASDELFESLRPNGGATIDRYLDPDLLIIDEVGVTAGSEFESRIITRIIGDRDAAVKPCILITNLDHVQLKGVVGDRAFDRCCSGRSVIEFSWGSLRGKSVF